jgi:septum formation protein
LLKKLRIPFRVIVSDVSEKSNEKRPAPLVRELALRKAQAVAKKMRPSQDVIVLGADTLVICRGKILGKPSDPRDAYRMLYQLSGSKHYVYTGVALVRGKTILVDHAKSTVQMKKISLEKLLALSGKHLDKAGSYAIQEKKDPIAQVVQGSYNNVVGLPVDLVGRMLKKLYGKRFRAV